MAGLLACTALTSPVQAQDAPPAEASEQSADIVVTGALEALPLKDVGSIFGFNKTLLETPRSASTISSEQIERFGITNIYDLVAQSPGTFTNSFFGVGGALDIRGTPGEVYFRGVRRLDNPGNYPTPIADLRPVQDRRLHEFRAQIGPRRRRRPDERARGRNQLHPRQLGL
jgi:iron complex outermembrane receptor protein